MRIPGAVYALMVACSMGLLAASAKAVEADECALPDYLSYTDGRLRHAAHTVATERRLDILVMGSGSSSLAGASGPQVSYPARLEAALQQRLPGTAVKVRLDVKPRRTAEEMRKGIARILLDAKPDLVIWQTGTVDAIRGVDPEDFRTTLEEGVQALQQAQVDVVLMNMQYSPRTEQMIVAGPFAESMHWVAQQNEVPLLDRLGIMRHWSETGLFDFTADDDKMRVAERVHDCLGKLLAEVIINTGNIHVRESRENR
jgi:hypothetical protein